MVATKAFLGELSNYGVARSTVKGAPLSDAELARLHALWRAANYLALHMIYLQDNPLLREELKPERIKPRMLGLRGTSPALSFIYTRLNRIIKLFDLDMIYLAAPGHGALGPVYIEGSNVPKLKAMGAHAKEKFKNEQIACRRYAHQFGLDRPDIVEWRWPY